MIDVDLTKGRVRQIVVPDGGDPDEIAKNFGDENNLGEDVVRRLSTYISGEIERARAMSETSEQFTILMMA